MQIEKVRMVYFSPTGTTRRILESVVEGIGVDIVEHLDVTHSERQDFPETAKRELLVIGAPVYTGRVAQTATQRFRGLKSGGGPAVIVVLYGNRAYEDALLELSDLTVEAGFVPIAGGAFIGEHSLSSPAVPLAEGRPDAADLRCAREFGKRIGACLDNLRDISEATQLQFPGNRPFREYGQLPAVSPVTEQERCIACGTCVAACPTGSIRLAAMVQTNPETCLLCCACVRSCPQDARSLRDPHLDQIVGWLRSHTLERKEPELFLVR